MTERLSYIFNEIPPCEVFADIACDHGYIAGAMLRSGKCRRAVVSDISAKSLKKAEDLLSDYINDGRAQSFVSDGFDNVPQVDVALVAGIGGRLTMDILERAKAADKLPETLVLQPMKHVDKMRFFAVGIGYKIVKDFTVKSDGQFYDIIVLKKGKDSLSREEAEFGRTNLTEKPLAFREKMRFEIDKVLKYLESETMTYKTRASMLKKIERLKKHV